MKKLLLSTILILAAVVPAMAAPRPTPTITATVDINYSPGKPMTIGMLNKKLGISRTVKKTVSAAGYV